MESAEFGGNQDKIIAVAGVMRRQREAPVLQKNTTSVISLVFVGAIKCDYPLNTSDGCVFAEM